MKLNRNILLWAAVNGKERCDNEKKYDHNHTGNDGLRSHPQKA